MTEAATFSPRARSDLREALLWIAADSITAAKGLNDAVEVAARRIGQHPALGAHRPALAPKPYRFWPIRNYPYLLVYTDQTIPPRILRVVHMARDLQSLLGSVSED